MDWHESEPSEDEGPQQATSRKRSSRACDQCRKTKSKCERGPVNAAQCKSCALAGTACTFLGPSYKRGPPKGYIRAIEMRWHQVESLLGAIIQCNDPRVQSVVSDLRQDGLAREILNRVDMGPYGPTGRLSQPNTATKEDFFASVLRSNESSSPSGSNSASNARDSSRSRRQSRLSREKVSCTQDGGISVVPTPEWQDQLAQRMTSSGGLDSPEGERLPQKRRLNSQSPPVASDTPDQWKNMYTLEPDLSDQESIDDPTEKFGGLSLDENHELRYHSQASGLHLLSMNARTDGRLEGGVWTLPMARVWPAAKDYVQPDEDYNIPLPPAEVQDRLISFYFAYIHPAFPVIHKSRFMEKFNRDRSQSPSGHSSSATSRHELPHLLLFSMFSIAARFSNDQPQIAQQGRMWDGGGDYFSSARAILTQVYHQSRPSTVQSLLLLGYREFGIGSMEQGWIYIGMAVRMAVDLGLNCNSQYWQIHNMDIFTVDERESRRQIWWCCCLADMYGSTYMGRPVLVRDSDFDTPFPEPGPEDDEPWMPAPGDSIPIMYTPSPCRTMTCFVAAAKLCLIFDSIVSKIYPVRLPPGISRRSLLPGLEKELDQFYVNLPEALRYDPSNKRNIPPPHVLFLHVRYFAAVLLLHRAFIPNWNRSESTRRSTLEMKSFDLSQSAASQLTNIANIYRETYTLKRSPPFMPAFMFSAGIMHLSTLKLRPSNVQATVGLRQALAALKDMEVEWPSAARAWELVHHVKIGFADNDQLVSPNTGNSERKRDAENAFGADKEMVPTPYIHDIFNNSPQPVAPISQSAESGVQDMSTRIMAHFLGLDVPGVEPSTSYLPGYEWWPRNNGNTMGSGQQVQQPMMPMTGMQNSGPLQNFGGMSANTMSFLEGSGANTADSNGDGNMNGWPNPVPYSYKFPGHGV